MIDGASSRGIDSVSGVSRPDALDNSHNHSPCRDVVGDGISGLLLVHSAHSHLPESEDETP